MVTMTNCGRGSAAVIKNSGSKSDCHLSVTNRQVFGPSIYPIPLGVTAGTWKPKLCITRMAFKYFSRPTYTYIYFIARLVWPVTTWYN